ncbi:flap endonuclease Xni [Psychromonas sp. RZ22]|uniref:flap endonuclease Xni n=1 Tax=Psychromonas algarum TaxID=2555643 RepID=UPI00106860B6|nr:flap endonuclease Xni [Psychromonas sp. RZ22]TEW55539.1 flap endonuclease Xni [Psychromonas sp. RZ22]
MSASLLIIDAMNLIRRIYAVQEKQNTNNEFALSATNNTACNAIQKMLRVHQPTHVICVFDSHQESWRHQLLAEYKEGRKPIPPTLKAYLPQIQDAFYEMGIESLITEQDEADDLIATLNSKVTERQQRCIIVSTDKGFYQLLNAYTSIYDYFKSLHMDSYYVENQLGLKICQLTDFWAIAGISSSHIKGVEGVGNKGALALLEEYQNLDNMLQQTETSDKRLLKVKKQKNEALLAKKLVSLKIDIELGFNLKDLRYQKK